MSTVYRLVLISWKLSYIHVSELQVAAFSRQVGDLIVTILSYQFVNTLQSDRRSEPNTMLRIYCWTSKFSMSRASHQYHLCLYRVYPQLRRVKHWWDISSYQRAGWARRRTGRKFSQHLLRQKLPVVCANCATWQSCVKYSAQHRTTVWHCLRDFSISVSVACFSFRFHVRHPINSQSAYSRTLHRIFYTR